MKVWLWVMIPLYVLLDVGYIVIIVFLVKWICEMRRERKKLERDVVVVRSEIERRKMGRGW